MIVRPAYDLPEEQRRTLRKACRLEWWTLGFLATVAVVMYLTMGNSQAMKTAWVEDVLSLIAPLLFLIAVRFHDDSPSPRLPYGKRRLLMITFLAAALALVLIGGFLLYDSVGKLLAAEHPTLGMMSLLGFQVWSGWVMIAALIYSIVPAVVLGRLKLGPAEELHEKTLFVDAQTNKADWMTGVAAILGILGIGFGLWWADGVAAALISADIIHDGIQNIRRAILELIDSRPMAVDSDEPDGIAAQLRQVLEGLDWVDRADLRLRDEGYVVAGEAFVVPLREDRLVERLLDARRRLKDEHWRVCDVEVIPLSSDEFLDRSRSEPGTG